MSEFLKEGDVIEIKKGHKIYANVPKHFVYSDHKGNFKLTNTDVSVEGELLYLAGEYIVTKTTLDGGGASHDGRYPNGHHVFCVKTDKTKRKINFYQSGFFTAMIENINPTGQAELTWATKKPVKRS